MLGILSAVVGLLVLLWMFYDFFWPPPPLADRQLGKPDQPVEYNLKRAVSFIFWKLSTIAMLKKRLAKVQRITLHTYHPLWETIYCFAPFLFEYVDCCLTVNPLLSSPLK